MTKEEIKAAYLMRDILAGYGMQPNRAGFLPCPFHKGDRDASMKIYDRDYHCFGCGANGDIFSFIMAMDNVDFKEAFLGLGGTYEEDSFKSKLARYHAMKAHNMRKKREEKVKARKTHNNDLIDIYREWYQKSEPFSQVWVDCYNALQYQLYLHEQLNEPR